MVRSNIPDSEHKRVTAKACSSGQGVVRLELSEMWNFAAKSIPYAPALSEGCSLGSEAIIDDTSASSREPREVRGRAVLGSLPVRPDYTCFPFSSSKRACPLFAYVVGASG